jgi:hypothetical protein
VQSLRNGNLPEYNQSLTPVSGSPPDFGQERRLARRYRKLKGGPVGQASERSM